MGLSLEGAYRERKEEKTQVQCHKTKRREISLGGRSVLAIEKQGQWGQIRKGSCERDEMQQDLPYSIELPDGGSPAPPLRLLPDQVLCILVSEDAGFAHQALVPQLLARQFPVDGFQAQQESAMAKPAQEKHSAA
jgi:hypothetical protein